MLQLSISLDLDAHLTCDLVSLGKCLHPKDKSQGLLEQGAIWGDVATDIVVPPNPKPFIQKICK
jgi:hypothetical protein